MPIVDTDYSAYVNATYLIAIGALLAMLGWSALRLMRAQQRLEDAESGDSGAEKEDV